jgi:CubicO group peptidase (beta-lactamase class C family)
MNLTNRIFLSFFILLLTINTCFGQITIHGKVLNRDTKEAISYVNIGVTGSGIGTLSNLDGTFSIIIPQKNAHDTLVFSALGFWKKAVPVKMLNQQKDYSIYLVQKDLLLESVIVTQKQEKFKHYIAGNTHFNGGTLEEDTINAGRSIALLIDVNKEQREKGFEFPLFLESARIRIFRNNLSSCRFRIRFNTVDSLTGEPGDDFIQQSIITESTAKNGWIEFNLSALKKQIDKPFFVTFEQILDLKDRIILAESYRKFIHDYPEKVKYDTIEFEGKKEVHQILKGSGIDLPGTFVAISNAKSVTNSNSCFVREVSLGQWKKVRGILCATVTLSNQIVALEKTAGQEMPCKENSAECLTENYCRDFMSETGMNGMQVCISVNNKVRLSLALGKADFENDVAVTDSTRFRINSISKSVTSLALVKLLSENKLDLDAPVQNYVPSFPVKQFPVTTRQLAGHLAGFRDYNEHNLNDYVRQEHFENATQALAVFKNDTLLFKPGTRFNYSTFGWNLIGAVIEGITKESYVDYMRKNIWQPLQLFHTTADDITRNIPARSKYYDALGDEINLGDLSYKYSGGGLLSTAQDLVKFGNELLNGTLISSKWKSVLFDTQFTLDNKKTGYGLGWYIGKDKNGHRTFYHSGDSFGGSSCLVLYPDDNIVIAFLGNSQAGVNFNTEKIGELFYNKKR